MTYTHSGVFCRKNVPSQNSPSPNVPVAERVIDKTVHRQNGHRQNGHRQNVYHGNDIANISSPKRHFLPNRPNSTRELCGLISILEFAPYSDFFGRNVIKSFKQ